jgi:(4S)-4-hydroxy-5-phosphonooxypentane-2,3-dione isomerase
MTEGRPFVIWVVFGVKSGSFDELHQVALEDAKDSVGKEAGCLEFNVLVPTTGDDRLALFEVYKSKEAFLEHVDTPHCQKFLAVAEKATTDKNVTEYYLTGGASRPSSR